MNAKEVAKLLGTHPENIRRWIRDGKIKANKNGRSFDIPQSEVNLLLAHKYGGELNSENERAAYTLINDYKSKMNIELNFFHAHCMNLGEFFADENLNAENVGIREKFEKLNEMYADNRFYSLFKTVRNIDRYQKMISELEEVAKESEESNSFEKVHEGHLEIENFHKMLLGDDYEEEDEGEEE
ncbi:DNA binding domain protein, excisionase family [Bacillus cereus]|nr:DNA binding domain protein, excisionase family [Bacillus cereus]